MPSTSASSHGKRTGDENSTSRPTPLWRKPVIWLGTIVVAAVSAAVTGWLQPIATEVIDEATETGEPVLVALERQNSQGSPGWPADMALPPDVGLDEQDLASLSGMTIEQQVHWLEDQGAVPTDMQTFRLALKGNRSDQVRITDMVPYTECKDPPRGSLVRLGWGHGANVPSTIMIYFINEQPQGPNYWDDTSQTTQPFFPQRTITLQEGEEEYVVVHLYPDIDVYCHVHFELVVDDDGEEVRQRIPEGEDKLTIMSLQSDELERKFSRVIYGGEVCHQYHEAPPRLPGQMADPTLACGSPENFKPGT